MSHNMPMVEVIFWMLLLITGPSAYFGYNLSLGNYYFSKHKKTRKNPVSLLNKIRIPALIAVATFVFMLYNMTMLFVPIFLILTFYIIGQEVAEKYNGTFYATDYTSRQPYTIYWEEVNTGFIIQIITIIWACLGLLVLIPIIWIW